MIAIYNDDALEKIEEFKSGIFDLIILDPDYQDWDSLIDLGFIDRCIELLSPSGNILCFTKQPFDYKLRIAVNPYFRREIVWTFTNGGAWVSNKMPLVSYQKIYNLVKSKSFYFNPRTGVEYSDKTKDFKRSAKVFGGYREEGKQFKRSDAGIWLRDHLHYNKPLTGALPSKPKELIEILINCYCEPEGLILDPFAGSGVIEKIAKDSGRDVIAIERDPVRAEAIRKLIEEG